ncbi:hypothetical protein [Nocardioides limicola]|uniref:hypothetical protein n=1 Tax=Nocardioides limicola TaxID=2803368 RepID=UPI00193B5C75|nr:hypothetical protein [Nocardioides sp. DJM-14]
MNGRTTPRRVRGRAGLAAALVLVLSLSACSSDDEPAPEPERPGAEETPSESVELVSRVGQVAGDLPQRQRRRTVTEVADVVDAWFEAAYVGGDLPRSHYDDAFPGFTRKAARLAGRSMDLMTNADIGPQIERIEVERRRVLVDMLSGNGRAAAATARIQLDFSTEGEVTGDFSVAGRLFLIRVGGDWRIIGFDVTKERS